MFVKYSGYIIGPLNISTSVFFSSQSSPTHVWSGGVLAVVLGRVHAQCRAYLLEVVLARYLVALLEPPLPQRRQEKHQHKHRRDENDHHHLNQRQTA